MQPIFENARLHGAHSLERRSSGSSPFQSLHLPRPTRPPLKIHAHVQCECLSHTQKILREYKPDIVQLHTIASHRLRSFLHCEDTRLSQRFNGLKGIRRACCNGACAKLISKNGDYNLNNLRLVGKLRYFYYRLRSITPSSNAGCAMSTIS